MTQIKTALALGAALGVLLFGGLLILDGVKQATASTDFGNYQSSRITSTNASNTATTRLLSQYGTLGSVIILKASAASTTAATTLGVYDTTSATSSSALIAEFATTTPVGVYTFDVGVNNGLRLNIPKGFTGQFVVTYR
jgi:hypothetical protein